MKIANRLILTLSAFTAFSAPSFAARETTDTLTLVRNSQSPLFLRLTLVGNQQQLTPVDTSSASCVFALSDAAGENFVDFDAHVWKAPAGWPGPIVGTRRYTVQVGEPGEELAGRVVRLSCKVREARFNVRATQAGWKLGRLPSIMWTDVEREHVHLYRLQAGK